MKCWPAQLPLLQSIFTPFRAPVVLGRAGSSSSRAFSHVSHSFAHMPSLSSRPVKYHNWGPYSLPTPTSFSSYPSLYQPLKFGPLIVCWPQTELLCHYCCDFVPSIVHVSPSFSIFTCKTRTIINCYKDDM